MTKKQQALWHTLAVGMFYRDQSEANPQIVYHWEQQALALKLHYQAKAKMALTEALRAKVHVHGGVAYCDSPNIEIVDHDNLEAETA